MEKTVCDSVRVACVWHLTRYGNCCIPYGRRGHVASDGHTAAITLSLLMSHISGAPCKARNFNVVYIWTYVWQR
jgi:hypothetical protein